MGTQNNSADLDHSLCLTLLVPPKYCWIWPQNHNPKNPTSAGFWPGIKGLCTELLSLLQKTVLLVSKPYLAVLEGVGGVTGIELLALHTKHELQMTLVINSPIYLNLG